MTTATEIMRRVLSPISRLAFFRRFIGPRVFPAIERFLTRVTRGRFQLTELIVPSLTLHTVGAKSGAPRDAPLMYTPDGCGRAIVAGTNWAGERHPGWTANLLAHPDAEITVRGHRLAVRATLVPEGEREATWAILDAQWPGFRDYERLSGRRARLFVLQPVRR